MGDSMENYTQRRHAKTSANPRLFRSKSGGVATPPPATTTLPETNTSMISKLRTSKTRTANPKNSAQRTTQRKKPEEDDATAANSGEGDGFVRFLPPRSQSMIEIPRRARSASMSPSAWALSPGRSLPFSSPANMAVAPVPKTPVKSKKEATGGGGVSGVLKYFRQKKKVSPAMEEEYHQFRVLYNTLLQWRFANARAEASMAAVKKAAQRKLFNGWVRISVIRNDTVQKGKQIQKMKQEMKLYHILKSQINLLKEWGNIESKNIEAVSRIVRKLSAVSICLPLVHDAEADIMSVYESMSTAMEVMDDIEAMLVEMNSQVEKMCFLLTELWVLLKQQKQLFDRLEKRILMVSSLEVQEMSLRAHHILLENEAVMGFSHYSE